MQPKHGFLESQQTTVFVTPVFVWGVFFPIFRAKNRQKPQNKNPPLKKGGLVDSRESTNPRFRNPRFLFGVFFPIFKAKKKAKTPKQKPPLKKGGLVDSRFSKRGSKAFVHMQSKTLEITGFSSRALFRSQHSHDGSRLSDESYRKKDSTHRLCWQVVELLCAIKYSIPPYR